MKVAFNTYPLASGHKTRGVGFYTRNLLDHLKKTSLEIQEFKDISEVKDANVVHYPWFDLFFRTLKLNKKIPTVVTVHDVMPLLFPKNFPLGIRGKINLFLQTHTLRSCKKIITVSNTSKKDIIKYLKIKSDKIVVIPEAASSNFKLLPSGELLGIKRKYNLPDSFLLYVGDANFIKNLPFLIEGFYKLREDKNFKDVKLVLVNGVFLKKVDDIDHPELESLKKVNRLIKNYSLEEVVLRPGQIEDKDLVAFYNLATLYVQPSLYEGFGLPLLEAFACGTPVLSSKNSSLPEVGGDAPVYFDPENLNQFVKLLKEILLDKSLQDKLSKTGLTRAKQFNWDLVTREVIKVYEEVTEK